MVTWLERGELRVNLGSWALALGSIQQVRAEPRHLLLQDPVSALVLGMERLTFTRKRRCQRKAVRCNDKPPRWLWVNLSLAWGRRQTLGRDSKARTPNF